MLTSKQRAYLRAMANSIETILMVGKGGISDDIVKQANDALKARELIKGKVLETAPHSPRDTAEEIAEKTKSDVIQVIGTKVYFCSLSRNQQDPKIVLPKSRKS